MIVTSSYVFQEYGINEKGQTRYIPTQPHPFYGDGWRWKRVKCFFGFHRPGEESEGIFCEVCLKQLKEPDLFWYR